LVETDAGADQRGEIERRHSHPPFEATTTDMSRTSDAQKGRPASQLEAPALASRASQKKLARLP
jgi:hypothetical protein